MRKKRMFVNDSITMFVVFFSLMIIGFAIVMAAEQAIGLAKFQCWCLLACFILATLLYVCFSNISCYIVLEKDKITLRNIFGKIESYSKKKLKIKYGIEYVKCTQCYIWRNVLIIGEVLPIGLVHLEERPNKRIRYGYFFFGDLSKYRLKTITYWWNNEIGLPDKEEWDEFCIEGQKAEGFNAVKKTYKLIEEYNKSISDKNNAQD